MLSPEEARRYARHLVLKDFGGAGQQKLKAASALVIGAGGLGAPVIAYLAAAGIGRLVVVDPDIVSLSNLQRQVIHHTDGIGRSKTESAARFVSALNPHVVVEAHGLRADAETLPGLLSSVDLVLDGSDTLETRMAVASAARMAGRFLVSGAVSMFDGQISVFSPEAGQPRFEDIYPDPDEAGELPTCEAMGVLGPVTGVIGTLMAMEAIKLLTGIGTPLVGRLLLYDGRQGRFEELRYG